MTVVSNILRFIVIILQLTIMLVAIAHGASDATIDKILDSVRTSSR